MESNTLNVNFDEIFLDVRRAYRLLYLYQRRVMDLMKFIGDRLSLRYAGGWSHFSSAAPRNGKGTLDNWAWDWLNMYHYEFSFVTKVIDSKQIRFSVFLVSDTAFFDAEEDDQRNLKAFPPAETSATTLVFLAGKDAWHDELTDFWENYKSNAPDYVRSTEKGLVVAKSFPLKRFVTQSGAELSIKGFTEFCASNGISELTISR